MELKLLTVFSTGFFSKVRLTCWIPSKQVENARHGRSFIFHKSWPILRCVFSLERFETDLANTSNNSESSFCATSSGNFDEQAASKIDTKSRNAAPRTFCEEYGLHMLEGLSKFVLGNILSVERALISCGECGGLLYKPSGPHVKTGTRSCLCVNFSIYEWIKTWYSVQMIFSCSYGEQ